MKENLKSFISLRGHLGLNKILDICFSSSDILTIIFPDEL